MKIGDRVKMPPDWKEDPDSGTIEDITVDYVIIKWDGARGVWYYNKKESEKIEIVGTDISDQQLEHVYGGMEQGTYEIWKTRWINQNW